MQADSLTLTWSPGGMFSFPVDSLFTSQAMASMRENSSDNEDSTTIKLILDGDMNRYEELIERYRNLVFSIVAKHLPYGEVEAVAQEVFVDAYRSLSSYRPKRPFAHWLSRIAARRCCDYWRKRKRRPETDYGVIKEEHLDWMEGVMADESRTHFKQDCERREAREMLAYALDRLKSDDRVALELVYLEGYSMKETARLTGRSLTATKVKVMRARKMMRNILEDVLEERSERNE